MRRVVQKYANFVLFGVLLFLIMVAILFNWVSHIVNPSMKTVSSHSRGDRVFPVNKGRVPSGASIVSDKATESTPELPKSDTVQAWLVVNEYGVEIRSDPTQNSNTISQLPAGLSLLGSVVHPVWISESELRLQIRITHPVTGWVTISAARIDAGTTTVTHYIRPLALPRQTAVSIDGASEHTASEPHTPNYCGNSSHHLPQMDYRGGDLPGINPVTVASAVECCQQCCANPACAYWTLVGQGECWLKAPTALLSPAAPDKVLISGAAPADKCGSRPIGEKTKSFIPENELPVTSTLCCLLEPIVQTLASESESARVFFTGLKYVSTAAPCSPQSTLASTCLQDVPSQDATALGVMLTAPVGLSDRMQALEGAVTTVVPSHINPSRTLRHLPAFSKDSYRTAASPRNGARSLHQAARLTSDWTEQQVVGNGRIGALVGGNVRSEVIPVSVAGLFVKRKEKGGLPKFTPDQFRAAREDLKNQQYAAADKKMSSYIKKNLGMFQYVADMAIVYSPMPITWHPEVPPPPPPPAPVGTAQAPPIGAAGARMGKAGRTPALRRALPRPRNMGVAGRARILRDFYDHLSYAPAPDTAEVRKEGDRPPFGDILVSDGVLDVQHGIAHTSILERNNGRVSNSPTPEGHDTGGPDGENAAEPQEGYIRAHHREWLASANDNVMVGRMTCQDNKRAGAVREQDSQPCLHAALKFLREHDPNLVPRVEYVLLPVNEGEKWQSLWVEDGADSDPTVTAVHVQVHLSGTENVVLPETVMHATVLCVGVRGHVSLAQHRDGEGMPIVVCNRASHVYIILSVESNGRTYQRDQDTSRDLEALKSAARSSVQNALEKGFTRLQQEHVMDFGGKMGRVELQIEPQKAFEQPMGSGGVKKNKSTHIDGGYRACVANPMSHRLESYTYGCIVPSTVEGAAPTSPVTLQAADTALAVQLYQYGRYLLLSSATGAVANLQGLWADGPGSAWNGDYHLNINLQMAYWAADAVRLPEVMPPLRGFVRALSKKGTEVASQMYGCTDPQAWAAHGFVDADLDGFPYGDNQWALCVTCGAWAALSVWEHLIMHELDTAALFEVTDTLRGVVLFFRHYMWRENSVEGAYTMHTGPTTSPENSYVLLQSGSPAPAAPQTNPQKPPLGRPRPGQPPPPFEQPSPQQQKPYSVQQLAFSPALDVSVLRQVAQAFLHCVAWARDLSDQPGGSKQLLEDEKLAAEFQEMVAHMPGGGLPVTDGTMHDEAHDLRAHLHRTAAQPAGDVGKQASLRAGGQAGHPQNSADQAAQQRQLLTTTLPDCTEMQGGCIREYPAPLFAQGGDPGSAPAVRSEMLDIGHRHFSALHWVYPNTFVPSADSVTRKALYLSAYNTLRAKRAHGSGHTGWSAVWEASLWARLHRPEVAHDAIERFMRTFVAPNLLSLHPPLVSKSDVECGTCFGESSAMMFQRRQQKILHTREALQQGEGGARKEGGELPLMTAQALRITEDVALQPRGMVTSDQSKFQIDGNLGYLAALNEMLLQSHFPGYYYLLPALPDAFSARGHLYGLQARGGVRVSINWHHGAVVAAEVVFAAAHPWLVAGGQGKEPAAEKKIADRAMLGFTAPNLLHVVPKLTAVEISTAAGEEDELPTCIVLPDTRGSEDQINPHSYRLGEESHNMLLVESAAWQHCVLRLCGSKASDQDCQAALRDMQMFRL